MALLPAREGEGSSLFPMRAFWWKILFDVACTLTVFTLLFSLAGYWGGSHWVLDLFSHFRVQYLAGGVLLAVVLLWLRRWRWSGVALLCVGMNAVAVLPWYGSRHRGGGAGTEAANLRVVLLNVFTRNEQTQRVLDFLRKEAPDILVIQEVDSVWRRALRELDTEMGHFRVYPQEDNFGIGIWSRLPLKEDEVFGIGPSDVPTIRAKVEVAGTVVEIIATHPLPPIGAMAHAERNSQLATIAGFAREAATPVVVIGDLNVTMWSPSYSTFIRSSGLVDARRGFGILPTWPTTSPFIKIPLDHCLVSPSIGVRAIRTGPHVGSDHLPVIVDLYIPPAKAQ